MSIPYEAREVIHCSGVPPEQFRPRGQLIGQASNYLNKCGHEGSHQGIVFVCVGIVSVTEYHIHAGCRSTHGVGAHKCLDGWRYMIKA